MQQVWTGPPADAREIARLLRAAGIEAIFMFGEGTEGTVFVQDQDKDAPEVQRAIRQVTEGGRP